MIIENNPVVQNNLISKMISWKLSPSIFYLFNDEIYQRLQIDSSFSLLLIDAKEAYKNLEKLKNLKIQIIIMGYSKELKNFHDYYLLKKPIGEYSLYISLVDSLCFNSNINQNQKLVFSNEVTFINLLKISLIYSF